MKKKVLVSGSTGQLGSELRSLADRYDQYQFVFKTKDELNLESVDSIKNTLQEDDYSFFINAGAYTAVDKSETDEELCFTINSRSLKWISEHALPETKIIHISTDYVYNLDVDRPLVEKDQTKPKGIYALSKLLGEELLLAKRSDSIVIRTSWVYSSYGHNFVKSMIRLGNTKDRLSIVNDQIGSPTYAADLAEALVTIMDKITESPDNKYGGIYNFSNDGATNWADFARRIFDIKKLSCDVSNISTKDYNAQAHRPLWSVMSKDKIQNTFGVAINPWEQSLANCLSEINI